MLRLVAEDDDTQLFPEFGRLVSQQSARFYQVCLLYTSLHDFGISLVLMYEITFNIDVRYFHCIVNMVKCCMDYILNVIS